MKRTVDEIVQLTTERFPSFGGGQTSNYNPITNALKDKPPVFAAGVSIKDVVEFVQHLSS